MYSYCCRRSRREYQVSLVHTVSSMVFFPYTIGKTKIKFIHSLNAPSSARRIRVGSSVLVELCAPVYRLGALCVDPVRCSGSGGNENMAYLTQTLLRRRAVLSSFADHLLQICLYTFSCISDLQYKISFTSYSASSLHATFVSCHLDPLVTDPPQDQECSRR
jgi:hypothetical protein